MDQLLSANDPFLFISEDVQKTYTVFASAQTVLEGLPFLSSLVTKPGVVHAELAENDFALVSLLKDSGFVVILSNNVTDAQDMAAAAYAISQKTGRGVLHFYTPVQDSRLSLLGAKDIESLLGETSEEIVPLSEVLPLVESVFQSIKAITGRKYAPFESVGASRAKDVLLVLGSASEQISSNARSLSVGVINIRVYRPFSGSELISLLSGATVIHSLEQSSISWENSITQPLMMDLFAQDGLIEAGIKKVVAAQLTGEIDADTIKAIKANGQLDRPIQNLTVGKCFDTNSASLQRLSQAKQDAAAVQSAHGLENAYTKLVRQIYGDSLHMLNPFESETVNRTPEFGFGRFLAEKSQTQELSTAVRKAVMEDAFEGPQAVRLGELLTEWLEKSDTVTEEKVAEIQTLLQQDGSSVAQSLLDNKADFSARSNWLIGSDAWAYDLGSSGVHHVLASGEDINMLIVESDSSHRKKDVGLYALNRGGAYVASVAVYSSYTQVLQALIEAGRHKGPSIVVAYLPYSSEESDSLEVMVETKKAVDSGTWPLYRFDPESDKFSLDSSSLRNELRLFLERENKLTLLAQRDPQLSRNLTASLAGKAKRAAETRAKSAYDALVAQLAGAPLTVAFASDGGNAQAVAQRLANRGAARGLKTQCLAMDELPFEDLALEENIVFVTSTAGQGEFPQNGRACWDFLKSSTSLDLATTKVAVFGLGDSEYWPRKEDKHYYNRPAVELDARLRLLGALELAPLGLGDDQDADGFQTGYGAWEPLVWDALGVSGDIQLDEPAPPSNEDIKINSNFLRGTIVEGLQDPSTGAISASDQQLTKFHGVYMQDDRDIRDQRKAEGLEPAYSFMARLRMPGGIATAEQWLKLDSLADERANGTLKITTRATLQFHGLVKHNLKPAIRGINAVLLDTLGACGDVNRNVTVSCVPHNASVHKQIGATALEISERLLPQTTAYNEIWLQGTDPSDAEGAILNDPTVWQNRKDGCRKEKILVTGNALVDEEPLYTPIYLPRKFKVAIDVPPYNDVDVFANDVGLIAIINDQNVVEGYNLSIGGGMGTTHNNKKTYPRAGTVIGYVSTADVCDAVQSVMLVQRDNGDRTNRKHARLKYTVDDMGVEGFKAETEKYWGKTFEPAKPYEITSNIDFFGWVKDENGLNHFTCFIENGRVQDTVDLPQKTGLREIAKVFQKANQGNFRFSSNQHMVISEIPDSLLSQVKELMNKYKLDNTNFSALRLSSSACVAFPTCGLAMAESERYLPVLIGKLESALEDYGLRNDSVVMRMSGCPNGCSRPWLAEVALVGKAFGAYNLMLGGGYHGERVNKLYRSSIKEDEILSILKPLFKRWAGERNEGEHFGDFLVRVGVIAPTLEGRLFHEDVKEE